MLRGIIEINFLSFRISYSRTHTWCWLWIVVSLLHSLGTSKTFILENMEYLNLCTSPFRYNNYNFLVFSKQIRSDPSPQSKSIDTFSYFLQISVLTLTLIITFIIDPRMHLAIGLPMHREKNEILTVIMQWRDDIFWDIAPYISFLPERCQG